MPYVADASACSATRGGWHYDVDPMRGRPTQLILCQETCRVINQVQGASIDRRIGCQTVPL